MHLQRGVVWCGVVYTAQVGFLSPEALLAGGWEARCAVLVIPGGADLPYCRTLNGQGNTRIRGGGGGGQCESRLLCVHVLCGGNRA